MAFTIQEENRTDVRWLTVLRDGQQTISVVARRYDDVWMVYVMKERSGRSRAGMSVPNTSTEALSSASRRAGYESMPDDFGRAVRRRLSLPDDLSVGLSDGGIGMDTLDRFCFRAVLFTCLIYIMFKLEEIASLLRGLS